MKQNEADFEHFKGDASKNSDTSVAFPEGVNRTHRRPADLRRIWDYLELLFSMLYDSYSGNYPVPKKTVIIGIFTLLYLINPIDIVPDFIPLLGFADDIAAFVFAANLIKDDLNKYKVWKHDRDYI